MRSFVAFTKKEFAEHLRSGRLVILGILFLLFGIMNPAVAKLTPWLIEIMAESFAESGFIVTDVAVSAMDSWVQFFKNIPMALIAFVLLEGGIFSKEYMSGTLILALTKGLERYKVILAKCTVLFTLWSFGYWICFATTYAYNAYFWDNSVAKNLFASVLAWWLFGIFVISLLVFFSVASTSSGVTLLGIGAVVFVSFALGFIPKLSEYLPTRLTDGNSLIYGLADINSYVASAVITLTLSIALLLLSIPVLNKKRL